VVIVDVENGSDEYARRLEDVLKTRDEAAVTACEERLRYYEFPTLKLDWTPEEWARSIDGADLVVFDSSRMALSSVGLSEDANDDYAKFVGALVVPLARANSTTLILDNVGHGDGGHPRGASAKGDLNEMVWELTAPEPFDQDTAGKVVWRLRRQRFSGAPRAMEQVLGGGAFELPKPVDRDQEGESKPFRPTHLMEHASKVVEGEPGCSFNFIEQHVKGKREYVFGATQLLLEEGYVRREDGPRNSHLHYSVTPYRESEDEADDWFPTGSPTGSRPLEVDPASLVPPSGSSLKGRTTGTSERPTDSRSDSQPPSFIAGVDGDDPRGCVSHRIPDPSCRYCQAMEEVA
jgi:hypothetical protein